MKRTRLRASTPKRKASRAAFRKAVLGRDFMCRMCGKSQAVHPHHILPRGRGGSDDPEQGVGLCATCHFAVHHTIDGQRKAKELGLLL